LNAVPFAALRTPEGRYLIEDRELVFLPSVTAWLALKAGARMPTWMRARREGPVAPVVIGKASFESEYEIRTADVVERIGFGSLPGARAEATAVAGLLGVEPLLDVDATVDAVIGGSGADVMHLATHGFLDEERPRASFLVLSDGLLVADELYRFDPGVRLGLVVMSACRTGLGGAHPDSVIGLANAFLIAGAQSVVSTLWRIQDDVTATMMAAFYRRLVHGDDVAGALRSSQLETLGAPRTSHPYYWGAFRVTGRAASPFS
jgi:CHAT domain-containing protein